MADKKSDWPAAGISYSQDLALGLLGKPSEFCWAQAVVLDMGGDDAQWMDMVADGTEQGARVGCLVVAGRAVAYGELLGDVQGARAFVGPKRSHPRWTWRADADEVTSVQFRSFVKTRFGGYSDVTIQAAGRSFRFGIDRSRDTDVLVCALRQLAGTHRPAYGPSTANLRSDGAYIGPRTDEGYWTVMAYVRERNQLVQFNYFDPCEAWQEVIDLPEGVTWLDLETGPNGVVAYGNSGSILTVTESDVIVSNSAWATLPDYSPMIYSERQFVPGIVLDGPYRHPGVQRTARPGHPTVTNGRITVTGYEPFQTDDELEREEANSGTIPVIEYLSSAFEDAIIAGRGFFLEDGFGHYFRNEIYPRLQNGNRVDLFVPIVVEEGARPASVKGADDPVKATGELHPGVVVTYDDQAIITWTTSTLRLRTKAIELPLSAVREANPFTLRAKLSNLPALELITDTTRIVITFTNHADCRADLTLWRNRLLNRFSGWQPVYKRQEVLRWRAPQDSGPLFRADAPSSMIFTQFDSPTSSTSAVDFASTVDRSIEAVRASAESITARNVTEAAPIVMTEPGWHPDPYARHQHRYWDGAQWTFAVADDGETSIDQV